LKYRGASSNFEEFGEGTRFRRVLEEQYPTELVQDSKIKKVILCSGQVYYDLLERRKERKYNDVTILRIEQLAPFPYDHIRKTIDKYSNAKFIWCQEEHYNSGAWFFVETRVNALLQEKGRDRIVYTGRKPCAATSTGSHKAHVKELEKFLAEAYGESISTSGNQHHWEMKLNFRE